jgi:UV DNA damage repair endonuclease
MDNKSITARVYEMQFKLIKLSDDCVKLISHPDATDEQVAEARRCMVDVGKRIKDVNERLAKLKLQPGKAPHRLKL